MSVEKYQTSKDEVGYCTIPNEVSQGLCYNLEALGLYLYIFSLPPNWTFYKSKLREVCNVGIKKINSLLKTLEEHGLLSVKQVRNDKGEFSYFDMRVRNPKNFINKDLLEKTPEGKNCRAAKTVRTVKNTYKRNIEKINNIFNKDNVFFDKKIINPVDNLKTTWRKKMDDKKQSSITRTTMSDEYKNAKRGSDETFDKAMKSLPKHLRPPRYRNIDSEPLNYAILQG